MNLEAIAQLIEQNVFGMKRGKNIFINNMPSTASNAILLIQRHGDVKVNYELPGYIRGGFQVIVRSNDMTIGAKNAKKVFDLLTISEKKIADMDIRFIRPAHLPIPYPISPGDLTEFSINFATAYVML